MGIEPPLHRAAAAATPKRAAIVGIAIAQIAPVDNPLLDFFGTSSSIVLFPSGVVVLVSICNGIIVSILPVSSVKSVSVSSISESDSVSPKERRGLFILFFFIKDFLSQQNEKLMIEINSY